MRLVSPFLKHVVYPTLAKTGYLRSHAGAGPAIVTYHGILPAGYQVLDPALDGALVSAESFRQQLHLLKEQYNVISPEEFSLWCDSQYSLPPRSVLLTCDDGLKNVLTDMVPLLHEVALTCLFFVTGGSLAEKSSILWYEELYLLFLAAGNSFTLELADADLGISVVSVQDKRSKWWDLVKKLSRFGQLRRDELLGQVREQLQISVASTSKYSDDPILRRRFLMMNELELRELAASGMSIGAHTLSHPMLSQAADELAWSEIFESRRNLEQALSKVVWALAYPFGDAGSITKREQEMADRAGFKCAFVNIGGGLGAATPLFALPRVHVTASMDITEFEAHISGFHRSLRQHLSIGTTRP